MNSFNKVLQTFFEGYDWLTRYFCIQTATADAYIVARGDSPDYPCSYQFHIHVLTAATWAHHVRQADRSFRIRNGKALVKSSVICFNKSCRTWLSGNSLYQLYIQQRPVNNSIIRRYRPLDHGNELTIS